MAKKPNKRKKHVSTTTTEQKLVNARALVAKYEAALNAEKQINNVQTGDDVDIKYGRAEKSRTLTGVVTAVADSDNGKMVAVQIGEGIDIEIKKVRAADIVANRTADARNAEEAEAA